MKKTITFFAINLLLVSLLISQPTLTSTGVSPIIGDSYNLSSTNYVSPGNSGANQTWDLSSLSTTSTATISVVNTSTTPQGNSFPNANLALSYGNSMFQYVKTSPTALQNMGLSNSTITMPYSNPEDLLRFPFTYNDTYSDTWATQFMSGGYMFYRSGTTTITADGYGTLITPAGTYTNTLRISVLQTYQDSAYMGMPYLISYTNQQYMWYREGLRGHIASLYSLTSSSSSNEGGTYVDITVGVDDLSSFNHSVSLSPNPTSDKIKIDFELNENKLIDIQIFNTSGQLVKKVQTNPLSKGLHSLTMDVDELSEGIYFAQIWTSGNLISTQRFIISR